MRNLKVLSELNGVSGKENAVRDYIISCIDGKHPWQIDALGNVIVFKSGAQRPKEKLMLAAHMDEVGFLVNAVTDDGFLKFTTVGGVDARVTFGREVEVGENKIKGAIGTKPPHLLNAEERNVIPSIEDMFVDIGASSKEEALNQIALGDAVCFVSPFAKFGEGFIKGKALDDRAGCSILLDLLDEPLPYDVHIVFTVQEEVGTRGAQTAAYTVNPDKAIVVETTTAADIPSVSGEKRVCLLGNGAVISYMDLGTVYDKTLYDMAFAIGKRKTIPCQTKTMVAGGNDARAIHLSQSGVQTIAVSIPTRYLHSANCVMKESDYLAVKEMVFALAKEIIS